MTAVPEAPPSRTVTVGGRRIAYREAGDASSPALVLLHGLGGNAAMWRRQYGALSDRFRVLGWDMPGYGGSDPLAGTPAAADVGEHVLTYTVTDSASPTGTETRTFVLTIATEADDPLPGVSGDAIITEITIDGATSRAGRLHVGEGGSTDVKVTVRWTNDDLRKIYMDDDSPDPVKIPLSAMAGDGAGDWLSPAEIDGRGEDVDLESMITITIPKKPSATASRNAHVTKTGMADIRLHDDNDAEDEEFYIMVGSATMGVNRNRSELKSADIVIDDDEMQGFALKKKSGTAY